MFRPISHISFTAARLSDASVSAPIRATRTSLAGCFFLALTLGWNSGLDCFTFDWILTNWTRHATSAAVPGDRVDCVRIGSRVVRRVVVATHARRPAFRWATDAGRASTRAHRSARRELIDGVDLKQRNPALTSLQRSALAATSGGTV